MTSILGFDSKTVDSATNTNIFIRRSFLAAEFVLIPIDWHGAVAVLFSASKLGQPVHNLDCEW